MRTAISTLALLALPALIYAEEVSLIDFVPRVDGVSGDCSKVYQQAITGCDSKDFMQQSCSVACVKALASMTKPVKDACGNEGFEDNDKNETNILAQFLKDQGPQNLCQNANDVLSNHGSSDAPSSSAEHSSTADTTKHSTTSVVSSTSTASSTDVPTSLVVDTSSSPEATSSTSITESADSSHVTTSSTSSQIFLAPSMPTSSTSTGSSSAPTASSEHSGGGSPFDAEGNQFSAATTTSSPAVLLILAITFTAFAAQW